MEEKGIVLLDRILVAAEVRQPLLQEVVEPCGSLLMSDGIEEAFCASGMIWEVLFNIFPGFSDIVAHLESRQIGQLDITWQSLSILNIIAPFPARGSAVTIYEDIEPLSHGDIKAGLGEVSCPSKEIPNPGDGSKKARRLQDIKLRLQLFGSGQDPLFEKSVRGIGHIDPGNPFLLQFAYEILMKFQIGYVESFFQQTIFINLHSGSMEHDLLLMKPHSPSRPLKELGIFKYDDPSISLNSRVMLIELVRIHYCHFDH